MTGEFRRIESRIGDVFFFELIKRGGLRRFFRAYLYAAQILSEIHGADLVYCDFSWNNVLFATEETPQDEFKPNEKVLQIEGTDCKLLVRIEGEGFDSRATAYRVIFNQRGNQNQQLAPHLAYGNMEFSDEQSFVAARIREILHESPNYIILTCRS